MDSPTYAVLAASALILGAALCTRFSSLRGTKGLAVLGATVVIVYAAMAYLGEFIVGWSRNADCYRYLGCNVGFYGYDAISHLFFGMALVFILIWLMRRFPKLSFMQERAWKTALVLFAFVCVIAVGWELLECADDYYHIVFLHETVFSFALHINKLEQSSNFDTMGDLFFGLIGALISVVLARVADPDALTKAQ